MGVTESKNAEINGFGDSARGDFCLRFSPSFTDERERRLLMAPAIKQHQAAAEGGATVASRCRGTSPFEASVERVKSALHRRGSFTEIMRKALGFCTQQRSFSEVEAEIATYPEFRYVEYSQAAILDILVQVGALEKRNLDKSGGIVLWRVLGRFPKTTGMIWWSPMLLKPPSRQGGHRRYGAGRAPAGALRRGARTQ